jgi:hypothetical protein
MQKQIIFSHLSWEESQNGYRRGILFIKRGRKEDIRPQFIMESNLGGWLATCGDPNAGSFETEFRQRVGSTDGNSLEADPYLNVRALVESPSISIGANLKRVGPESIKVTQSSPGNF